MIITKEMKRLSKKTDVQVIRLFANEDTIGNYQQAEEILEFSFKEKSNIKEWRESRMIFNGDLGLLPKKVKRADWVLFTYTWDGITQGNIGAFWSMIKVGDKVSFRTRINNSDLLRDSRLVNEELLVVVWRKDKKIINEFIIDSQVSRANGLTNKIK